MLAVLLTGVTAVLVAADLSGSYSGVVSIKTPDGERTRRLAIIIKQTPENLSVSIGPSLDEQHAASNVKLEGDKLTFEVIPPGAQRAAMKCDLRIEQDKLTGTQVLIPTNEERRTGTVNLKRQ
jgi:hypothetical protein